jgi:UDP:flavonoid glycosyltransferase YjiC (YdhE family)
VTKTILIIWEHGGNLGHLSRLLPIAIALREAQWKVVFAAADEIAAKRFLDAAGFGSIKMPRIGAKAAADLSGPLNHAEILLRMGFERVPEARSTIGQWQALFETVKPVAVLVDASPLALYAARSAGIPAVVIGHGFEIPPEQEPRPCFMPWIENSAAKTAELEVRLEASLKELAKTMPARYGEKAPKSLKDLFHSDGVALCAWPELDHFDRNAGIASSSSVYTGPIWSEPSDGEALSWPDGSGPKVLCYLNLRDKRYDLVWQALKSHEANVLIISPSDVPKACEAARGWGIKVAERPIQLSPLMKDCDAVVGHGGMGLTSMALHAGKPVLLLPEHMEQTILAYRLGKQGLALATIRQNDKSLVNQKISRLLHDDSLRLEVRKFAAVYSTYTPSVAVEGIVARLKKAIARQVI